MLLGLKPPPAYVIIVDDVYFHCEQMESIYLESL